MTKAQREHSTDEDWAHIQACLKDGSQNNWEAFFQHYEGRFKAWIRGVLRDCPEEDREDVYQSFAAALWSGNILYKVDRKRDPNPYLQKCLVNLAREHHTQRGRHANEPLEENLIPLERLHVIADQAVLMPEEELQKRLFERIRNSSFGVKELKTFLHLLEKKKLKDIAQELGVSRSAVSRYVADLEAFSYAALDVPIPGRRNLR